MGMLMRRRPVAAEQTAEAKPVAEMTRDEMVEAAKAKGIKVPAKATKADIQKLIDGE